MVNNSEEEPFWKRVALEDMTREQWESLCDGCGRCCLIKLEDQDTGEVCLTRLACRLLDLNTCRCRHYADRQTHVHDCVSITPEKARTLSWLPGTCAYRLVAEGRDLAWWHPLVSGDPGTVHEAGISVRGWAKSEEKAAPSAVTRYIVEDFGHRPKRAPSKRPVARKRAANAR